MLDPLIIIIALAAGLSFKRIGFPPMLGYLLAGFVIHWLGLSTGDVIEVIANAGVTLLLFTIGLKLNIRDLVAPQIWAVASVHMLVATCSFATLFFIFAPYLERLSGLDPGAIWTIAFALSFSSTVFAVKVFEQHGESAAIHANIAIGILIIQDIAAVVFLAMSTGKTPDWTAVFLLLLIWSKPLLHRFLRLSGHGELLILFGIGIAFGGAALFEACNVKGDLGAIIFGVLLAGGIKSNELSKSLLGFKDIFLVGFFLSIGLNGMPDLPMLAFAIGLAVAGFFKPLLFYWLMTISYLRARTALIASLSLANYSEFGLIVAALAASNGTIPADWVVTLALALSISFFVAAPVNDNAHAFYNQFRHVFSRFELTKRLAAERIVGLENVEVMVLGMGRVGVGAYRFLRTEYPSGIMGIEESDKKSKRLKHEGYNTVRADASDRDLWQRIDLDNIKLVLVSLANHVENVEVVELLQSLDYKGQIAVVARFSDEMKQLKGMGCITYNLFYEGGHGFAEHVLETMEMLEDVAGINTST